jgi:hypothetical protein
VLQDQQGITTFIVAVDAMNGKVFYVSSGQQSQAVCDIIDTANVAYTPTLVQGTADTSSNGGYDGTCTLTNYSAPGSPTNIALLSSVELPRFCGQWFRVITPPSPLG